MLLQVKKFYQKILQKWQPENQFHALVCLQRVKRNFYWKMKFLKQATYIIYETAKLSKFVQNSTVTSTESFLAENSLKTIKGLELVFRPYFSYNFLTKKNLFSNIAYTGQISLSDCLLSQLFNNMCFVFHAWAFDDIMISQEQ